MEKMATHARTLLMRIAAMKPRDTSTGGPFKAVPSNSDYNIIGPFGHVPNLSTSQGAAAIVEALNAAYAAGYLAHKKETESSNTNAKQPN